MDRYFIWEFAKDISDTIEQNLSYVSIMSDVKK